VEFPENNSDVKTFTARINEIVEEKKDSLMSIPSKVDGLDILSIDSDGQPLSIQIQPNSPYWPTESSTISSVAAFYDFSLYILESSIEPTKFNPIISVSTGSSDFIAMGHLLSENSLIFKYKQKKLFIFGSQEIPTNMWRTNGNVRSLVDLYGSQLFLKPPYTSIPELPERYTKFVDIERNKERMILMKAMNIKTISLSFAEGHQILVDGKRFNKSENASGNTVFSLIVPPTLSGVESLRDEIE